MGIRQIVLTLLVERGFGYSVCSKYKHTHTHTLLHHLRLCFKKQNIRPRGLITGNDATPPLTSASVNRYSRVSTQAALGTLGANQRARTSTRTQQEEEGTPAKLKRPGWSNQDEECCLDHHGNYNGVPPRCTESQRKTWR